jgi:hypothetical protein
MVRNFLLALVAATTGCVSPSLGAIDYETSGGFAGEGDGTSPFHVEPSGRLTRTKPGGGTEILTLDPAMTSDLYAKVANADFASLEPSYDACCDLYVYLVTVELDGAPRNVSAAMTEKTPERLTAVIEALQQISRSLESPPPP